MTNNRLPVLEAVLAENKRLREALQWLIDQKWKSIDRDNMEFECRTTCFVLERAREALGTPVVNAGEDATPLTPDQIKQQIEDLMQRADGDE